MNDLDRPRNRPPVRRGFLLVAAAVLFAAAIGQALTATPAEATSYQGWGDTGWNFYNKRDCCEEAVWLAQEDSIRLCENAGGRAKVRSGSTRGLCDWDARGDAYDRIYRCTANADVYCR